MLVIFIKVLNYKDDTPAKLTFGTSIRFPGEFVDLAYLTSLVDYVDFTYRLETHVSNLKKFQI